MENRDENERDGHGGRHENEPDGQGDQPMIGIVPRRTHTGILRTLSSTSGSINESHHTLQFSSQSLIFQTNCTQTGSSKLHSI